MSPRRLWTLLLLLLAVPLAGQEAGEIPMTGPELVALVKKLSHEDFQVREQATRDLIAQGKEVGPKLFAYRSQVELEAQERIDRVLEAMGMMAPEKEQALEQLLTRLFEVPAEDRPSVADDIAALGRAAMDRFQARLLAGESELKAVCTPGAKWYAAGTQEIKGWTVQLRNEGNRPLFIATPRINRSGFFSMGLAPSKPWMLMCGSGGGGGHMISWCRAGNQSRPYRSLVGARVLAPGQSIELTPSPPDIDNQPGRCSVDFKVEVSSQEEVNHNTLWIGSRKKNEKGEGWEAQPITAWAGICIYPDWSDAQTARGVVLRVASKTPTVRAGTTLEADVCLENQSGEPAVVDAEWMRYCWVAFAHHDGKELVPGTAYEHRSPKTDETAAQETYQPRKLAPGESVTQRIAITVPVTEGLYHLSAGYELPPLEDREEAADKAPQPGDKLVARALDIQVLAAEPARP